MALLLTLLLISEINRLGEITPHPKDRASDLWIINPMFTLLS